MFETTRGGEREDRRRPRPPQHARCGRRLGCGRGERCKRLRGQPAWRRGAASVRRRAVHGSGMWAARGTGWEAAAGARCRRGRAGACRAGTVQPAPRMCRTARAASVGYGAAVDGCRTRSAHGRVNGDLVWCGPRGAFGDCCSVCAGSVAPSGCPAQSSTVRSIRMTSTSTGRKTRPVRCASTPPCGASRHRRAALDSIASRSRSHRSVFRTQLQAIDFCSR